MTLAWSWLQHTAELLELSYSAKSSLNLSLWAKGDKALIIPFSLQFQTFQLKFQVSSNSAQSIIEAGWADSVCSPASCCLPRKTNKMYFITNVKKLGNKQNKQQQNKQTNTTTSRIIKQVSRKHFLFQTYIGCNMTNIESEFLLFLLFDVLSQIHCLA